jgi:hypothetical protein
LPILLKLHLHHEQLLLQILNCQLLQILLHIRIRKNNANQDWSMSQRQSKPEKDPVQVHNRYGHLDSWINPYGIFLRMIHHHLWLSRHQKRADLRRFLYHLTSPSPSTSCILSSRDSFEKKWYYQSEKLFLVQHLCTWGWKSCWRLNNPLSR